MNCDYRHHHHHHHLQHHQEINHPFLVDLTWSSKDKSFLYMLFPYVSGGELFSYLRRFSYFESVWERFWRNPSQRWPVQLHDHLLLLGRDCRCSWLSPLSVCGVQVLDVFMRYLRLCWMRARMGFIFWCKNRIKLCKANLLLPSCMCRLTLDTYPLNIAQSFSFFTRPCKALESLTMEGFCLPAQSLLSLSPEVKRAYKSTFKNIPQLITHIGI